MKKLIAMLLALTLVFAMVACGTDKDTAGNKETEVDRLPTGTQQTDATTEGTHYETAHETVATAASTLEALESIWALYADNERFPVMGGDMENAVDGKPGSYSLTQAENLQYNLLLPAELTGKVTEAATMIHMMNGNTFTCGALRFTDGYYAAAKSIRDAIQSQQWMCGFPDSLYIVLVENDMVIMSFGMSDAMGYFTQHVTEAYPNAEVLYNEAITG